MSAHWLITPHADEIAEWINDNLDGTSCQLGRDLGARGRMLVLDLASPDDLDAISTYAATIAPSVEIEAAAPTFGGTQPRLAIYSRNAVSWLSARSWCNATKKADIAKLKEAKAGVASNVIDIAADELSSVLEKQFGVGNPCVVVTHVACGHSKRPDCFACQLAQAVAARLGLSFRKVFRDRFVEGVSHPKEFRKLPPIELHEAPDEKLFIVIDDVATSGWHMEEALSAIRQTGAMAMGAVWISGSVD